MDDLLDDINRDAHDLYVRQAVKKTQATMARVEARLAAQTPHPAPERKPIMSYSNPHRQGEAALAKATDSLIDSERIIAAASASPAVDAPTMGVISSLCSARKFDRARQVYLEAVQKHTVAKAADPISEAMSAVATPNPAADVAAVTEAVGRLERALTSITTRLDRLETRQPAAATAPRTLAKGSQGKRARTAEQLHVLVDRYIDSPQQAGVITSLITAGQLAEAEQHLLAAKRAHDTEKTRQERKLWQQS